MKESVFVDSFAWIAAINKSDNYHKKSLKLFEELLKKQIKIFTTNYIIVETINSLSKTEFRKTVIEFVSKLEKSKVFKLLKLPKRYSIMHGRFISREWIKIGELPTAQALK